MPCFYCGKRVSLVRQLTDADFCSQEHRKKYHELTRTALNRLVEAHDQLAAATPKRKGRQFTALATQEPLAPPPEWGPLPYAARPVPPGSLRPFLLADLAPCAPVTQFPPLKLSKPVFLLPRGGPAPPRVKAQASRKKAVARTVPVDRVQFASTLPGRPRLGRYYQSATSVPIHRLMQCALVAPVRWSPRNLRAVVQPGAAASFPVRDELLLPSLAVAPSIQPPMPHRIVPCTLGTLASQREAGPQSLEVRIEGTRSDITWPQSALWRMATAGWESGPAEETTISRLHNPFPLGLPQARPVESRAQAGCETEFRPPALARPRQSACARLVLLPAAPAIAAAGTPGPVESLMAVGQPGPAAGFPASAPASPRWMGRPERISLPLTTFLPSGWPSLSRVLPESLPVRDIAPTAAFRAHELGSPELHFAPGVRLASGEPMAFDTQALRRHRAAFPQRLELETTGAGWDITCKHSPLWQLHTAGLEGEPVEEAASPSLGNYLAVALPPARTPEHGVCAVSAAELLPRAPVYPHAPACAHPVWLASVRLLYPGGPSARLSAAVQVPHLESAAEFPAAGISRLGWTGPLGKGSLAQAVHLPLGSAAETRAVQQAAATAAGFPPPAPVLPDLRLARFTRLADAAHAPQALEGSVSCRRAAVPRWTDAQIPAAAWDTAWTRPAIWQLQPVGFNFAAVEQRVSAPLCEHLPLPAPPARTPDAALRLKSQPEVRPLGVLCPQAPAYQVPCVLPTAALLPAGWPSGKAPRTALRPGPEPLAKFPIATAAFPAWTGTPARGSLANAALVLPGAPAEAGTPARQFRRASAPAFEIVSWSLPRSPVSSRRLDLGPAQEWALVSPQQVALALPAVRGMMDLERIIPALRAVSTAIPAPWTGMERTHKPLRLPLAQSIELLPIQTDCAAPPRWLGVGITVPAACLCGLGVRIPYRGAPIQAPLTVDLPAARVPAASPESTPERAFRASAPSPPRPPALPAAQLPGTRPPVLLPLSRSAEGALHDSRPAPATGPSVLPIRSPIPEQIGRVPVVVSRYDLGLGQPAGIGIQMLRSGTSLPRSLRSEMSARLPAFPLRATCALPLLRVQTFGFHAALAFPNARIVPLAARLAPGVGFRYSACASPQAAAGLKPCVLVCAPLMSVPLPVGGGPQQAARISLPDLTRVTAAGPGLLPASGKPVTALLLQAGLFPLARNLRDSRSRPRSCAWDLGVKPSEQLGSLQSLGAVEPSLAGAADFELVSLPRVRSARFGRPAECRIGFEPRGAVWPQPAGIPGPGPFRMVQPAPLSSLGLVARALPLAARQELAGATCIPVLPPPRTGLPAFAAGLSQTNLLPAAVLPLESRRVDTPKIMRLPPGHPVWVSGPVVPSAACRMECRDDLDWPLPVPIEPQSKPLQAAAHDRPVEIALVRQPLLPEAALLPVRHWFVRAPSRPKSPWKNITRRWKTASAAGRFLILGFVLLVVPGFIAWNSGAGDSLRLSLQKRAAIKLDESFGSGLDQWMGRPGEWSRDPAGFVRVGSLALLRPSVALADYRLEFLAQVGQRSFGWVFRASDFQNYYATKIVVTKAEPLLSLTLERYQVIDGKEGPHVRAPLRLRRRDNSAYKVALNVKGNDFTTFIDGQVVDFWSDHQLKAGGVGFFSDNDDQGSLYWVRVSHQDDLLGRLCAYLAPKHLENRNGSWK